MSKQTVSIGAFDLFLILLIVHIVVNSELSSIKAKLENVECVVEMEVKDE